MGEVELRGLLGYIIPLVGVNPQVLVAWWDAGGQHALDGLLRLLSDATVFQFSLGNIGLQ